MWQSVERIREAVGIEIESITQNGNEVDQRWVDLRERAIDLEEDFGVIPLKKEELTFLQSLLTFAEENTRDPERREFFAGQARLAAQQLGVLTGGLAGPAPDQAMAVRLESGPSVVESASPVTKLRLGQQDVEIRWATADDVPQVQALEEARWGADQFPD